MKKHLSIIAVVAAVLFTVPSVMSCKGEEPDDPRKENIDDAGNKPADKPDEPEEPETPPAAPAGIACAADLVAFADSVNSGHSIDRFCENGTVVLTADIDMSSVKEWTPVGNAGVSNGNTSCTYTGPAFTGTFDGRKHVIYNFRMEKVMAANTSFGLFGVLDGASVNNLVLGKEGDSSLFKVSATGTADAGVLAGTVLASSINNVINYIPVQVDGTTASARFTAGIVGFICSNDKPAGISEVDNFAGIKAESGSNTGNGATGVIVGGIAGFSTGAGTETTIIENCENHGEIAAKTGRSSGIAGAMNAMTMMRYCVNRGNVVNDFANGRVGALTCIMGSGCTMDDCTNYGDVICSDAQTTAGGMVALLNHASVVVTGGGNYGRIICANDKYHGLLCANFSAFSKVDGCYAGGSCWTFSADGKHIQHEITKDNLPDHLGGQAASKMSQIFNITSPYGDAGGSDTPDTGDAITLKDAGLRILFIGNSFTKDAVDHLPAIMSAAGLKDYTLAHCYYGGRTIPEYNDWSKADYTLYKAEAGAASWTTHSGKVSIGQVANGGRWDVVTLQEHTGNYHAWVWSTEEKDAIIGVLDKVSRTQKTKPLFYYIYSQSYFNMAKIASGSKPYATWPIESTHSAQLAMYEVCTAQAKKVMAETGMDGVIATGTMLQNLRTTVINNNGWDLTRDGYHMDYGIARYGAACTVFESIVTPKTGKKLDGNTYRISTYSTVEGSVSTPVTDATSPVAIQAARYAIEKPFEITDMSKVEVPGYGGSEGSDIDLKGSGTDTDPYRISKAEDMKGIAGKLKAGDTVYFQLTEDIDMSGLGNWEPVCITEDGKGMKFDGQGHTIKGFKSTGKTYASLFGVVNGTVTDLNLENCEVSNSGLCGVLAAECGNSSGSLSAEIINVHAKNCTVTVNGASAATEMGGLSAIAGKAKFTGCSFEGKLSTNKGGYCGGLVGKVAYETTIERCWTDIEMNITSGNQNGGILGAPMANKPVTIRNCYSKGKITGKGSYMGGITGEMSMGSTCECCWSSMSLTGGYSHGGITGRCSNLGNPNSGGTFNTDFEITVKDCIAWNPSIQTTTAAGENPGSHYSSGAVVAFTVYKTTLQNCWRRPDMNFNVYTNSAYNTLVDQPDSGPANPYTKLGSETYYTPYHGKAADTGESVSDVAKRIGWDTTVWDLSGSEPTLK